MIRRGSCRLCSLERMYSGTASMKLRRPQITEKYGSVIESFYSGGTLSTPEARA